MSTLSALIALILGNKFIAGALAAIAAAVGIYFKGRRDMAKAARTARTKENLKAATERLEMDREATEAERKAAGMTDQAAQAEAMKWARKP